MTRALILSLGLVLAAAAVASAQTPQTPAPQASQQTTVGPNFVDANGDGICDHFQAGTRPGRGWGRGQGTGTRIGPQDGTGYGPGPGVGGGTCDGTGPKGKGLRRGQVR
jgi:hypothetical protein